MDFYGLATKAEFASVAVYDRSASIATYKHGSPTSDESEIVVKGEAAVESKTAPNIGVTF